VHCDNVHTLDDSVRVIHQSMHADFNELACFAAIARLRSFRKAADERNVTASSLSHTMRSLEERLGVRLLNRTTRSVVLTDAGSQLLSRIEPMLAGISEALDQAHSFGSSLKGTLRLNVPRPAGRVLLAPIMDGFLRDHPETVIELITDDGIIDIVQTGFDAGVRFGESVALDMVAVPIGPAQRLVLVASPAYVSKTGPIRHPEDLKQRACIGRRFPSGLHYAWEFEKDGEKIAVRVVGPLVLDDDDMMVKAAAGGIGYAYVHESTAKSLLDSGQLVRSLDDWCPFIPSFHLYYPSRRHVSTVLRAFIDWCNAYYAGSGATR